jgi:alpha-N-arabinofuranosidase
MSDAAITVRLDAAGPTISPLLYGHFAEHLGRCIDGGIWVGPDSPIPNDGGLRADVVAALRQVRPPVLRWPGGCFADDYHWRDGIGPPASRPRRVNIWWGEDIETNAFGTHEFVRFCRLIGAEPYVAGNVGSGTPAELRDWVEYCNFAGDSTLARERAANGAPAPFGIRFWGVGNENWGCGGHLAAAEYAALYRRYATYLRDFGDRPLYLVACGPNGNNHAWTQEFFAALAEPARFIRRGFARIHGYAAHYYTDNRDGACGTATDFDAGGWYRLLERALQIEPLVVEQRALLDVVDPERRIGLLVDEWGAWHPPAPGQHPRHLWQQNTLRDALVAALTLDIFNRHADKVVMANIAQTVNVLQALLLTDGAALIRTPTYHVFDLYAAHQGAQSAPLAVEAPAVAYGPADAPGHLPGLAGSASRRGDRLTLTVVNPRLGEPVVATIELAGGATATEGRATVLTHADPRAHNTAAAPDEVAPAAPRPMAAAGGSLRFTFPPQSVTRLELVLA